MTASSKRNLTTLQAICGEDYSPRIVIICTHWTDRDDDRRKNEEERVRHFNTSYWKKLIVNGAHTDRLEYRSSDVPFPGNSIDPNEARSILHTILGIKTSTTSDLLFRHEVVKQKVAYGVGLNIKKGVRASRGLIVLLVNG
jgi:hypothetical protein